MQKNSKIDAEESMEVIHNHLKLKKKWKKENSFCCGCRLGFLLDISFITLLLFLLYIALDPEFGYIRVKLYENFGIKT